MGAALMGLVEIRPHRARHGVCEQVGPPGYGPMSLVPLGFHFGHPFLTHGHVGVDQCSS